ncbi:Hydroxycinnamoyl-Coenzyme A shikimate/quinate hydroxycinnamoyltransferase [Morus notabilis]|uniref:Hydroxycinnamoyl-Coenzyme A shikimate/quinate hydroxycinnamoyltransferase n=1 Tax=Morus notabilis TaxID=981085 RepID=W9RHS9_9ROSA|nr:shikimate O-hydroxycinnamoyltransferase [Morus notabilis]EXB93246.1 Hydroxycinnamoyl-Coenzyme A shikimate/quinate hydroxycinnamoyltransferase [Morus notabilis]
MTMLERKSRVNIHSKLTTVSSRPVGPGKAHPFTALDHAMGLHSLHVVFYYKANIFKDFDLDPSRVSLSDALSLYPPVTGRIVRNGDGNWEVNCNDAGVRIVRASVGTTLDEWLRSADGVEEKDLAVWDDMPEDPINWSPFRIQVNEFEGGGVAIGLSCTHMHADPTCATLLYKSWIDTHRSRSVVHPPVFSRSVIQARPDPNTETSSAAYYAAKSAARAPPSEKMATATFKFSHAAIKRRLMEISENCTSATPFDLLAALFWTRVARLKVKAEGNDYSHSLSVCTDARMVSKENGKPVPLGYYGNALHFSLLSLEQVDGCGLGHVVREVHCHVESIDEEWIRSSIDWLESRKGEGGKYGPPFRMYGPELTCIRMDHMIGPSGPLTYEAGFGEEAEPIHVSYHVRSVEGEGLILVMPSPEGGLARAVTVTLPEKELAELSKDEAILGLDPTFLLSGSVRY